MEKQNNPYLSQLAKSYPASGIRRMFDLALQYDNTVNLTLGEPNFDTPANICNAAKQAIDEGFTHYNPNAGLPELRDAVAERYQHYWSGYKKENVIITVGAMEALTMALMVTIDKGDEVLIPDPCFPNYIGQVMIAGGTPVSVPVYEEHDHKIQAADIEKAITPKTKALLLNSPSNPLGSILEKEDIIAIAKIVEKHNLLVFSDEVYDAILFDGRKAFSMAQIPELRKQVFILNSFSKSHAMTGWRIGYIVAEEAFIKEMTQMQEGVVSCVPTFVQKGAIEALRGSQENVDFMIGEYLRRRDILIDGFNAIPGFTCKKPAGSFYAFPNISAFGKTSQEFAEDLLDKAGVIAVPGTAFGTMGEGFMRFVFAASDENLHEAVKRIGDYVKKYYRKNSADMIMQMQRRA